MGEDTLSPGDRFDRELETCPRPNCDGDLIADLPEQAGLGILFREVECEKCNLILTEEWTIDNTEVEGNPADA